MIGYVPLLSLVSAEERDGRLCCKFTVSGDEHELLWDMPPGGKFQRDGEAFWVEDENGDRRFPSQEETMFRLHHDHGLTFDVQYIGQAYGTDGSRNAHDRLVKHETLQRIALTPVPAGKRLEVILLELQPGNRIIQMINPWAQERDEDGSRVSATLDTLYGTTEAQQVSLYEAAMIRYFQPQFNKEFKNSFPSTNLKILSECYDKDMAGIVAEFCFDELPFYLKSDIAETRPYHIVAYNIHGANERDIFFGRKSGNLTTM